MNVKVNGCLNCGKWKAMRGNGLKIHVEKVGMRSTLEGSDKNRPSDLADGVDPGRNGARAVDGRGGGEPGGQCCSDRFDPDAKQQNVCAAVHHGNR